MTEFVDFKIGSMRCVIGSSLVLSECPRMLGSLKSMPQSRGGKGYKPYRTKI